MKKTMQEQEIEDRLQIMGHFFDLDALLEARTDPEDVGRYYKLSDFAYRLFMGRTIHMGLSDDGFYHKEDLLKPAQFVERYFRPEPMNILEVGAGRIGNTRYLAKRHPEHQFTALDLPGRGFLKNKAPRNVKLVEGDYSDLSCFPENSFDLVYGVETICYAHSKERVISEISRVLKPGGWLVIFDGYNCKTQEEMTDFERHVAALACAGMRVTTKDQYIGNIPVYLERHGYGDIEIVDVTQKIRPTLRRLDRMACYTFMHPRLLRFLQRHLSQDVMINAVSGWLMLFTVDGHLQQYVSIVARKQ
jgi:SAM-dependent methyltransferase